MISPSANLCRYFTRLSQTTSSAHTLKRCYSSNQRYPPNVFRVSSEVEEAVRSGKPVVALETTIYTHGFPYPDNVALATHLESIVRVNGGTPATIGVLNGVARVGLSSGELVELASAAGKKETMKVSRRDLPYITGLGMAGKRINGGTTIAGTMILARMAGIEIFGTGGLGGVHRGGEVTMDISADLTELGRTPVTVISSGCKSFLDIPRTLEYLETQGVSISTFADGRTGDIDLPAFWTRESGIRSPSVVQNEREAAAIIYARRMLGIQTGLFFANPIPLEHSILKSEIDKAIEEAVQDAEWQGVFGHANTPFILARIKELTQGKSITANRALIESNVTRATKVAVELVKLDSTSSMTDKSGFMPALYSVAQSTWPKNPSDGDAPLISVEQAKAAGSFVKTKTASRADILVAGSVAVDLSCDYTPLFPGSGPVPVAHTSNPAVISQSVGGVGHNVATAAHLIGNNTSVRLCSHVADDLAGKMILSSLEGRGLDTTAVRTLKMDSHEAARTAQYVAVNDENRDLVMAMADMRIISSSATDFGPWQSIIEGSKPRWVVVDANWDESAITQWMKGAKTVGAAVAFEPASVAKSRKLFPSAGTATDTRPGELFAKKGVYPKHDVELATPNQHELAAMHQAAKAHKYLEKQDWWTVIDALGIPSAGVGLRLQQITSRELVEKGIPQQMIQLLPYIPVIITKLGPKGVVIARLLSPDHPLLRSPGGAPYILSRCTNGNPDVGGIYMRLFPAAETVSQGELVSVNGVGDTFLGVLIAGLAKGLDYDEQLINVAQRAAVMTLKSSEAVSPNISDLAVELDGIRNGRVTSDYEKGSSM